MFSLVLTSRVFGLTAVPLLSLALALVDVRWHHGDREAGERQGIDITAPDRRGEVVRCLDESLKARLRFEARICKRRSGWFDYCRDARFEAHTVTYDELTESYRVVLDRFDDKQEPIALEIANKDEAVVLVTTVEDLRLTFLAGSEGELLENRDSYLQVRTVFTCRGNSSRPFAHISRFLTLGLLNTVEDRSDWADLNLYGVD